MIGFNHELSLSEKVGKSEKKLAGEAIFNPDTIHEIRITFQQCNAWDSLFTIKKQRDSLAIKRYLQGNVEVNGKKYYSCGVRFKGESSYEYYPGKKKSFKINFGEFVKKQKLDGLKTINLNNAFKDPTFMREKLYLDFMREEGLPVPRCTYANVYLNNEYFGLYVLVEEINRGFLNRHFQNKNGSFFKGEPKASLEYLGDKMPKYLHCYKNKNKSLESYKDLKDLICAVNRHSFPELNDAPDLEEVFNVEACLKIFAITNLFANVDAYNLLHRHNFYLYKNTTTKQFEWIPYDGNYAFCAFSHVFTLKDAQNLSVFYMYENTENPLLRYLFGFEQYRRFYADYISKLLEEKFTVPKIEDEIDKLSIKIRKHVYADKHKMYSNADFEENLNTVLGDPSDPGAFIPGLKSFVKYRIKAVKEELNLMKKHASVHKAMGHAQTINNE